LVLFTKSKLSSDFLMCGFCNVWVCVYECVCGCEYVWVLQSMGVCTCGFCNVWVCV
jgi:hypothetical protein